MQIRMAFLVGLLAAIFWTPTALAGDITEDVEGGSINWTKREITCTGKGAPNLRTARNVAQARILAEQAAKLDAMRNCLEAMQGLKLTAVDVTAGKRMEGNGRMVTEIKGVLRNFEVAEIRYYSDGGVELDIRVKIDGEVAQSLMRPELQNRAQANPTGPTGIIIDAREHELVPVLAPRIVDPQGNAVYSVAMVNDAGVAGGIVRYYASINGARRDPKVMGNPVEFKAIGVNNQVDVVISEADAQRLREMAQKEGLLSEGKVIFVKR